MSITRRLRAAVLAVLAGWWASPAWGQHCDCEKGQCPPFVKYHYEGIPRICFKCGPPKPICDPCHLPHFGYYPTCWSPWPFPPDWSHCCVPPPAALVQVIPPKRFREPPRFEDIKPTEETGPKPTPIRPGDGARINPQWLPPGNTLPPMTRQASLPLQPLPTGPIDAPTVRDPFEPRSAPKPLPPSLAPSLAPPPAPVPPVIPPVAAAELKPAEKPADRPTEEVNLAAAGLKPNETEGSQPQTEAHRPQTINSGPGGPQMRMVNSRRILLDYDLADVPRPEQAMLELWYTQDGKKWVKDEMSITSGAPYIVEVNREGTYGFMMIARAPGEKSTPPAPGEAPQVWVEVDWTRPNVQLADVRVNGGPMGRTLSLAWTATDNNLARTPITLSYSEMQDGPWKAFASNVENTGRFDWQVPNNVPQKVFVKVEALDLVGNVGVAVTPAPVQLP